MNQIVRKLTYQTSSDRLPGQRTALTDELLKRIAGRAADYDRDNRFFHEDLDDLRQAKYLLLAVPLERLSRDVRSGPFHPPNSDVAHDLIGKTYLGVLGEQP